MRISDWSSDVCSSDLDKADHGFVGRAKFGRRRLLDSRQVPYALDARHLHAEADAEIGHAVFAREADAGDLAFRPARSERAGHEDRVARFALRGDRKSVV